MQSAIKKYHFQSSTSLTHSESPTKCDAKATKHKTMINLKIPMSFPSSPMLGVSPYSETQIKFIKKYQPYSQQQTPPTPVSELQRMNSIADYTVSRQVISDLLVKLRKIDKRKNFVSYTTLLMKVYSYILGDMKHLKPEYSGSLDKLLEHIVSIKERIKTESLGITMKVCSNAEEASL
jgi:hypothetical protein